jgi:nitrite reductase/ring-hydroxylating ferredoxin subunit
VRYSQIIRRKNAKRKVVKSMGFVKVAETPEIAAGKMKVAKLEGKEILVANVNGKYYAIGDRCTHAGGDLSKGSLEGNIVTCPKHGAKFDVTTGKVVSGPKVLFMHPKIDDESFYEVKVEGKDVLLKIE